MTGVVVTSGAGDCGAGAFLWSPSHKQSVFVSRFAPRTRRKKCDDDDGSVQLSRILVAVVRAVRVLPIHMREKVRNTHHGDDVDDYDDRALTHERTSGNSQAKIDDGQWRAWARNEARYVYAKLLF